MNGDASDELGNIEPPSPAGVPITPGSLTRPHQMHGAASRQSDRLWQLMAEYIPEDKETIERQIVHHVEYTLCRTRYNFDNFGAYQAAAYSVRDRLIELWNDTHQLITAKRMKRVYYLSLEFLIGRSLQNAVANLRLQGQYASALSELGYHMEDLFEQEKDAALGNGGLGRLAACFLDSMATHNLPGWGYGIRYEYGMFQQRIANGAQIEMPDYWLTFGNPWEIQRLDVQYPVRFYGGVTKIDDGAGHVHHVWDGGEIVRAVACDTPIPGYGTRNTINLRLWSAKPAQEFDLHQFNQGDYMGAIDQKQSAENITRVLYPADNTYVGKELRLKQQFFFVSATLQDILRRFKKLQVDLTELPQYVALQLNDTHPSISVAELMRLLIDEERLPYDTAWTITRNVHAFTNHTVLPEALERWPVSLMEHLLPRHMQIIYEINHFFMEEVARRWPGDVERLRHMSVIDEDGGRQVRMAHLAIIGSHSVNGVAKIHSELIKTNVFTHFYELWPHKFNNKTNGVTQRRWIHHCNPGLAALVTKWVGTDSWLVNLDDLAGLEKHANNPELQRAMQSVKLANKRRLAKYIHDHLHIDVNPHALFDVQCKRLHEYKRQLLNILSVIHRYKWIKSLPAEKRASVVKRVVVFAGKAAPGYDMAKRVIRLINAVADVVNADREVGDLLKVVFIPNYNVSVAEVIIPANDISQHISTAGTEASGTSNMKFVMNGGLIVGTLDGANIEIREHIGKDNMFIFGATVDQVGPLRQQLHEGTLAVDKRFWAVVESVERGEFGAVDVLGPLMNTLRHNHDHYLLGADFQSYLEAQMQVDTAYQNPREWVRRTIVSVARMGYFSSDRTIAEYAQNIWKIERIPIELLDQTSPAQ